MTWVALVGQWDEDDSSPESVYWFEVASDLEAAKLSMLRRIGQFIASEVKQSDPCVDCLVMAGEELAALGQQQDAAGWRGSIDGNDYVVAQFLDEATVDTLVS